MFDTFTGETYNTLCRDAENYLASGSPEQARELLLKAVSLIGTRPRARSILSDTCMSMELWSEARSQLEILITLEDGNASNNFRLAQVLEELGEYQLAFDNYSVVLEDEPDHHGALVALKRIAARTKESGVNLADIFAASSSKTETSPDSATAEKQEDEQLREGIQVFPDVPTDSLFADSENEKDNSIEKLLKNIGLSQDESEEEDSDDISKLLESIGVSTTDTLQSVFSESGEEEIDVLGSAKTDSTGDTESTDEETSDTKKKPSGPSLDEIFGTPSTPSSGEDEIEEEIEKSGEEVTETVEEESQEQEQEQEAEGVPEDSDQPASDTETDTKVPDTAEESETAFGSSDSLQAIFNDAETEETHDESVEEETIEENESDSSHIEVLIDKAQEEETTSEEEEAEEQTQEEETVLYFDPWSMDSGLLTVHLTSGSVDLDQCLLTVFEDTLSVDITKDETCNITGKGTFLLNCGSEEPLILELSENMTVRLSALILTTGPISSEPLDGQIDNSLAVLKDQVPMKGVFRTPSPIRVILLGGNKRIFNVRTASIIASDPGIVLSNENSPDDYTAITGFGKLYLIE